MLLAPHQGHRSVVYSSSKGPRCSSVRSCTPKLTCVVRVEVSLTRNAKSNSVPSSFMQELQPHLCATIPTPRDWSFVFDLQQQRKPEHLSIRTTNSSHFSWKTLSTRAQDRAIRPKPMTAWRATNISWRMLDRERGRMYLSGGGKWGMEGKEESRESVYVGY